MTPQPTAPEPFLPAAVEIGRALCREAIWDAAGRMCNWMGRSPNEITEVGGPVTPTSAALGPDLYGGSLGVAWFLAQLGSRDRRPRFPADGPRGDRPLAPAARPVAPRGGIAGVVLLRPGRDGVRPGPDRGPDRRDRALRTG